MERLEPSQPEEQGARSGAESPERLDDVKGHLDNALDVLEQELERAQSAMRLGEEEPTRVVGPPEPLALVRTEPEPLTRGTSVGRYLVLERLGAGGMGEVYAAFDPQLNRRVALKLLLPGGEGQSPGQARLRLMREAQSMARLSHPHVLPVYDIGEHGDRVFIALEHVEGSTLRQWLKEARRPWREVLGVLAQAGEGLAAAHAAGLVHRDFKPDNVLVGRDGRVLVYDFGLACEQGTGSPRAPVPVDLGALLGTEPPVPDTDAFASLNTREPLETPVTRAGLIMGTPGYMAPEQYRHEPLTGHADQFSFCATLHYALYGEHAFEGSGAAALARATLEGRLRPVPRDSDVPGWVRQVILRGLSPRPVDRYTSMEELLEVIQGEPRARRWRQVLAAVAMVFLGAVVAGAVGQWHQEQSVCQDVTSRMNDVWDAPRQEAVRRALLATGQPYAADAWTGVKGALDTYASAWVDQQRRACEATRLRGETSEDRFAVHTACLERRRSELRALTGLLAEADSAVVEHAVEAVRGLSELGPCESMDGVPAPTPLPRDPGKAAHLEGSYAQLARARALRLSGQYAAGLSAATTLAGEARVQGDAPLKAEALLELGRQQLIAGEAQAERSLREAAWTADEVGLDEVRAEALVTLTRLVAYDAARALDGHDFYQQARALLARTRRQGRLLAELESAHGLVYAAQGAPLAAEASQLQALAELEKVSAVESPEGAVVLRRLGLALSAQGRHAEALTENLRAHAAFLQTLGAEHPRVGSALVSIGGSLSALGRPTEALTALRQGVDIVARTLPPQHPFQATALDALGAALWRDGQGEEARRVLRRAVEASERARGPEHPDTAQPCTTLGRVLVDQGRPGEALTLFSRALRLRERALGPQHPDLAAPLTGQGEALLRLGRAPEALAPLERALVLRSTHTVPPEALAETRFALARALWDTHTGSARALLLAREAEHTLERSGTEALRAQVQAWLAERSSDG
ncbi:tetratricopeptide repeat protein [Cystobacter fuscus]|uniref:tetratricopeptide repeat protein n=1 Tax=Cystobacter fuscus TaxID=43 RepID=UPI002B27D24C|nr:tetratricopeptide repeat protein [Cystobacter fuscus]